MSDNSNIVYLCKTRNAYTYRPVATPLLMPQAAPCAAVVKRWVGFGLSRPPSRGPLVEGLRVAALEEAATLVWAHNHGLTVTAAQLFSEPGARRRRFDAGQHTNDALARALLAGPAAKYIADPQAPIDATDPTWSEVLGLVGDADYVAQVWVEHMIHLTGQRTWFTLVAVANELLSCDRLSREYLSDTIDEAVFAYDDPQHEHALEGLQPTRDHALARGSEPIAEALAKAAAQ